MKKFFVVCLIMLCCINASAQDFEIVSVECLERSMQAVDNKVTEQGSQGRECALIRIATQNITQEQKDRFDFGTDMGSKVEKRAHRDGEIWLWVTPGMRYLIIKGTTLGGSLELAFDDYGVIIQSLNTYKIVLRGMATPPPPPPQSSTQQFLMFSVTPKNATLEVNGELWSLDTEGNAVKYVNFGTYTYLVRAADHFGEEGTVTVNDPENTVTKTVTLRPNYANVTLKVDADAEIWVNNQRKGVRTWTGQLGSGTYKIECRMDNHETSVTTQEIMPKMDGQVITLPVPTPIYGSLLVESTPAKATIFIDGREVGTTPKSINEILIGQHEIRMKKDGYRDYVETIVIAKNEKNSANAILDEVKKLPQGAISGIFSVSETQKVYFSKGNLQYQASTNTWRFAEHQWDCVGGIYDFWGHLTECGNVYEKGVKSSNNEISPTYSGWIDLFGWGTSGWSSGAACYQPWCISFPSDTDYYPGGSSENSLTGDYANADWGEYNAISNGGNQAGLWRTLTKDEWEYIFDKRSTVSGIRYARAKVNDINGVILLPDDWNSRVYSLTNTNRKDSSFDSNSISALVWNNTFSPAGAVFLPAAGRRGSDGLNELVGHSGQYWSASSAYGKTAYSVNFGDNNPYPNNNWMDFVANHYRCYGASVRLVCPAN